MENVLLPVVPLRPVTSTTTAQANAHIRTSFVFVRASLRLFPSLMFPLLNAPFVTPLWLYLTYLTYFNSALVKAAIPGANSNASPPASRRPPPWRIGLQPFHGFRPPLSSRNCASARTALPKPPASPRRRPGVGMQTSRSLWPSLLRPHCSSNTGKITVLIFALEWKHQQLSSSYSFLLCNDRINALYNFQGHHSSPTGPRFHISRSSPTAAIALDFLLLVGYYIAF